MSQVFRTDHGEQGIVYERDLVRLDPDIGNVVYDTHSFDPYAFTTGESADFDAKEIE